jgi:hypothetical protein
MRVTIIPENKEFENRFEKAPIVFWPNGKNAPIAEEVLRSIGADPPVFEWRSLHCQ